MLSKGDILKPFAESIHAKVNAEKLNGITVRQARYLKRAMSFEIRHLCDALMPDLLTPMVSKEAYLRARSIGVDLRTMDWHDQPRFDPDRKVFHLEHMMPVSMVRDLCRSAASLEEVIGILDCKLSLVWILKDEDAVLSKMGFRNKRPDPAFAYRAAGICLVE